MALACVALKAAGPVVISGAECVAKSYPDFFKDLQSLGATVQQSI
jgi:3-phosphoshikimate 1-carboxyvinyltransferase